MTNTVVGLLDQRAGAEEAVDDLVAEGFDQNHIRIVANDQEFTAQGQVGQEKESGFHSLMVKLGFLEERRQQLGWPPEDVGYYAEGVRRGGVVVTVDVANPEEVDRAVEILEEHGAVDIQERAQQWMRSGWNGPEAGTATATGTATSTVGAPGGYVREGGETRIPVVEEELKVGKRSVEQGGVRVYRRVSETPVSETVTLREEHVNIERHPVDRPLASGETSAFKESVVELTEMAEEAVIAKQAQVVEEVVVSKGVTERTETVHDTVRRTEVEVENLPPGPATGQAKPKPKPKS